MDKSRKGVYFGLMPGNLEAYGNLIDKLVTVPDGGKYVNKGNTLDQFALNRAGVLPQVLWKLGTGQEYINGPDAKNRLAATAAGAAPIGADSAVQGLERGVPLPGALASANLRYGSASGTSASSGSGGRRFAPCSATRPDVTPLARETTHHVVHHTKGGRGYVREPCPGLE
jgi:hypothetical protein